MIWKKREPKPKPRKPGITGTGQFISNREWTLWDDTHSPGLIGFEKFDELKALVLTPEERSKFARFMVADAMASKGPKHTPAEEQEAAALFAKLNAYLVDIRVNKFDQLGRWLDTNFTKNKEGRIFREDRTLAANVMLAPIKAYLSCLEFWGYGYSWEDIEDSKGEPALLVHRELRTSRVILQSEVDYVQGKPYRFGIHMRASTWFFEDRIGFFEISVRGSDKKLVF